MFARTADVIDHMHRFLRQNLAAYMTARGWSVRRLAEETGVPHTTITTVLAGKASVEQAQRLDRALPSAWTMELGATEIGHAISLMRRPQRAIETWLAEDDTGYFMRDRIEIRYLKTEQLAKVLTHWEANAENGLPVWNDDWHQKVVDWGNVSVADVSALNPFEYSIIYFANTARRHAGKDKQGTLFGEDRFRLYAEALAFDYLRCKSDREPVYNTVAFRNYDETDGRFYERLLLPLRQDPSEDAPVSHVISAVDVLDSFGGDRPGLR